MAIVKTTLDIDGELVARAKAQAAREGTTLTSLIEEGLRLRLRKRPGGVRPPPELPVYAGRGGLAPGVDPRSNRSLNDAADGA